MVCDLLAFSGPGPTFFRVRERLVHALKTRRPGVRFLAGLLGNPDRQVVRFFRMDQEIDAEARHGRQQRDLAHRRPTFMSRRKLASITE